MLRRLFAPRKRLVSTSRPRARLHLEQLERREVLDAALVQGFNFLTINAFQTAQQIQQLAGATQSALSQFHSDAASYTAGQGVTLGQINQDMTTLHQNASAIQGLNGTFATDTRFFIMGLMANAGNFSSDDTAQLAVDAFFLLRQQPIVAAGLQTAASASSVTQPDPPPPPPPAPSTTPTSPITVTGSVTSTDPQLVTLTLNSLNINLLGVKVHTEPITINIAAQSGNGDLLGNLLTDTSNLLNLPAVSGVVNNVLANVVTLLNSGTLSVTGVNANGPLSSGSTGTTSVLTLHVAPVTLNLMGALVTTSPIDLTLTAQAGQGLVLGNVVSDLANLFNPPLPNKLTLQEINGKLDALIKELNAQIPNIGTNPPTVTLNSGQFLNLIVSPLNVNLLGLQLQTSAIDVTAANQTGNGDLLGNLGTVVLNTIDATPTNLTKFNNDVNAILYKVISVLNASTLTIPSSVIGTLSLPLQQLTSPTLVNSTTPASVPILNLAIASPNGSTPVNVNLLGLQIATSNIQAQLTAKTGDGQILGNLLYNLANLLNPGGTASLVPILTELGL